MSASAPAPATAPAAQRRPAVAAAVVAAVLLSACAIGPDYRRPDAATPAEFKEAPPTDAGWWPAAPADALDRGPWWELFGDATLNALVPQVDISNQTLAGAVAAYAQARALVSQQRATLFPALGANGSAARSGGAGRGGGGGSAPVDSVRLTLDASWEPDLWGRLARGVESAQAGLQASEADLASARLSTQAQVASNYFALRDADAEIELLRSTVEAYRRSLQITQNRYAAGIAPRTDVLQAQTQLANTEADRVTLTGQRAQLEHAIAVLIGQAPSEFSLPPAAWTTTVPAVPLTLPSELLQRRPDIASAERNVAVANAQIGIQRSAYFPSLALSSSYGNAGSRVPDLFGASTRLWSIGTSVAQTIFDAGATRARVASAEAARDAAVARYRQSVLSAFQSVEDQLAAARSLAEQAGLRREASEAADLAEQQFLNRYKAGQVSYTEVATAQAAALNARRTLAQLTANRQAAAIGLIQALGGGWHAAQ